MIYSKSSYNDDDNNNNGGDNDIQHAYDNNINDNNCTSDANNAMIKMIAYESYAHTKFKLNVHATSSTKIQTHSSPLSSDNSNPSSLNNNANEETSSVTIRTYDTMRTYNTISDIKATSTVIAIEMIDIMQQLNDVFAGSLLPCFPGNCFALFCECSCQLNQIIFILKLFFGPSILTCCRLMKDCTVLHQQQHTLYRQLLN